MFQIAYTFDAGPNACLYLLEEHVEMMLGLLCYFFRPADDGQNFVTGLTSKITEPSDVSEFHFYVAEKKILRVLAIGIIPEFC